MGIASIASTRRHRIRWQALHPQPKPIPEAITTETDAPEIEQQLLHLIRDQAFSLKSWKPEPIYENIRCDKSYRYASESPEDYYKDCLSLIEMHKQMLRDAQQMYPKHEFTTVIETLDECFKKYQTQIGIENQELWKQKQKDIAMAKERERKNQVGSEFRDKMIRKYPKQE